MKVKGLIAATEWRPSPRYGLDRPRVSVLLPTFCRGQSGLFLRSARSVLDQSLADLELIVVDDASTDGTADQIRQLMAEDDRVSCLRHPRNVGLPAVSEYEAFRKARADYLAFAFDDDEFYPHALGSLLAAIGAHDHSIVYGTADMLVYDPVARRTTRVGLGHGANHQAALRGTNYIPNNAVMLHRRVVRAVGFYDPHVALSRLCDWDLWRRAAECFPIVPVDVRVGLVSGPAASDSLGRTRLLDQWQSVEWADLPRNEQLKPGAMEDYDVLAVPDALSLEGTLAVEDIRRSFRDKFWYEEIPRARRPARGTGGDTAPATPPLDGHLLVVSPCHDASTTLCFDHLPAPYRQRVRIAYPGNHQPEEMVGASAVVFVRNLFGLRFWIAEAQRVEIPCYYFLDDNFMLVGGNARAARDRELGHYTDDEVRRRLRPFAGVLLSSCRLIDYFREKELHPNLVYYPPIAGPTAWRETPPAPPKPAGVMRIAFFGGSHRLPALREQVLPAIAGIAREHPLELFAAGVKQGSLPAFGNLAVTYFPFENSYDIALARMAACEIDFLVHPGSHTRNNEYKTLNVLINARAMGAVPVVEDAPPYSRLRPDGVALLCDPEPQSFRAAIATCWQHPQSRQALRQNLDAFCAREFGGQANTAAVRTILESHPVAGAVLRELRWRLMVEFFRRPPLGECLRSLAGRALNKATRITRDSWPVRTVRRLGHALRKASP